MKVLILGASGFLGRYIVEKFNAEGAKIVTIVRRTSHYEHLKSFPIKFIEGDVRDENCLKKAMQGVDVVVHCITPLFGRWEDFYAVNVESTERLLSLCKNQHIKRFVYISSVDAIDTSDVQDGTVLTEDTPRDKHPTNFYGRSKIEGEEIVEEYRKDHQIPTAILRPTCVYGIGGYWYPARLGMSAGSRAYILIGNGKSLLPMIHASSIAEIVWRSVQNDTAIGKIYNLVEDGQITRLDFLKQAKSVLFPKMRIIKIPFTIARFLSFILSTGMKMVGMSPPTRLHPMILRQFKLSILYSNELVKKDLGWTPLTNLDSTIRESLEWHYQQTHHSGSAMLIPKLPVRIGSKRQLKVGIVGCGAFAGTHAAVLKRMKQANVIAVSDENPDAVLMIAKHFKKPNMYNSAEALLANEQCDVIHIVTPPESHLKIAEQAFKKGCHVMVEKPATLDALECQKMAEAAKIAGRELCIDHTLLYNNAMIRARKIIQSGILGDIIQLEGWFGTAYSSNLGSPYLRYDARDHWIYQMPGSLFQDFLPHPLSVILEIMQYVENIEVFTQFNKIVPHMKYDEMRLILTNETIMTSLSLSMGVTPRHAFLNIYGTKSTLKVDFLNETTLLYNDIGMLPKMISRPITGIKHANHIIKENIKNFLKSISGKQLYSTGHETLFRLFYQHLLENTPMPVPVENGFSVMETMDRIWKKLN